MCVLNLLKNFCLIISGKKKIYFWIYIMQMHGNFTLAFLGISPPHRFLGKLQRPHSPYDLRGQGAFPVCGSWWSQGDWSCSAQVALWRQMALLSSPCFPSYDLPLLPLDPWDTKISEGSSLSTRHAPDGPFSNAASQADFSVAHIWELAY